MRKLYDENIIDQVKNLIDIDSIKKRGYKMKQIRNVPDWENYVSNEYLDGCIERDEGLNTSRDKNLYSFPKEFSEKLIPIVEELYPDNKVTPSGYFYYPPTGFCSWHTNFEAPYERLYITYSSEEKKSFFRYYQDGKVITDYDDKGITFRQFKTPSTKPYFWHCVGSECDRFSFGYRIS
tara:strand:- start:1137 stop:1673 length:537 start_codon:yes stop_codon:yes gene_type:complete